MSGPKALVTGGAGFLGHHLVADLLAHGWSVDVLDNFSNGRRVHLSSVADDPRFCLYEGDLRDADLVHRIVTRSRPRVVFHLAALHFIPYCQTHPAETIAVNVVGTQHLLDALTCTKVEAFILASTADVYRPAERAHSETDVVRPNNIYGLSKSVCEDLLQLAAPRLPEARLIAARLFNLIGPGETNPHVVPEILERVRRGETLRLGNLTPRRDYVFVKDAAVALRCMASYRGQLKVFNVGTGRTHSVVEVVRAVERVVGRHLDIEVDAARVRPVEREHLAADISLAQRELQWSPQASLNEGLAAALAGLEPASAL